MLKHAVKFGMVAALLVLGCRSEFRGVSPQGLDGPTVVRAGFFSGLCEGYWCNTEIRIVGTTAEFTAVGNRPKKYPEKALVGTISESEWNDIVSQIDMNSLLSLESQYGCPDCADGGGSWLEVKRSEVVKRITWEPRKSPAEIEELLAAVGPVYARFACRLLDCPGSP